MKMQRTDVSRTRFVRFAWFVVVLNYLVIVWGGFTSASGSGDGCGTDWPLCGNLLAEESSVTLRETLVEFSHRATSGLALLAVIVMVVWAYRLFPRAHRVRYAAVASLAVMIVESLLGAGLVIFEWVDTNYSMARALVQPIHLLNTFLLSAAIALTAWWAAGYPGLRLRGRGRMVSILGVALLGLVLIGMFGTFASLASTIFPSESFVAGVMRDFSRDEHWLIRLRIGHPLLATAFGAFLIYLRRALMRVRPTPQIDSLTTAFVLLYVVQYALGALNAVMLTPIWVQLAHLALSHALWLLLVFAGASALGDAPEELPAEGLVPWAAD